MIILKIINIRVTSNMNLLKTDMIFKKPTVQNTHQTQNYNLSNLKKLLIHTKISSKNQKSHLANMII